MNETRFDHCLIAVSDWDRSNAFYRDVVGAEVFELTDGRWGYRVGDHQLSVHGPGVADGPIRPAVKGAPGSGHVCFEWVGPIADAVERLGKNDVPIEEGPVERTGSRGPGKSVYFRDPDGNLLEFISYE